MKPSTLLTMFLTVVGIAVPIVWSNWQARTGLELRLVAATSFSAPADESFRKDLVVSFRGKEVKNLAKYRFSLVNTGANPIDKSAVKDFPKLLIPEQARLLQALVAATRPDGIVAQVRLESPPAVSVEFDLLNPSDSIDFDVYIDGQLPGAQRPSGRIRGVTQVKYVDLTLPSFDKRILAGYSRYQNVATPIFSVILTGTLVIALIQFALPRRRRRQELLAKPDLLSDARTSDDLAAFVNTYLDFAPKFVSRRLVERINRIDLTQEANVNAVHEEIAMYLMRFAQYDISGLVGGIIGGLAVTAVSFGKLFSG